MANISKWSLIDGFRLAHAVGPNLQYTAEEFIVIAEKAIERHPNAWVVFYMLGNKYQEVGRYADSLRACKRCVELRPDDIRSAYALATAYNLLTRAAWTSEKDLRAIDFLRGIADESDILDPALAQAELDKVRLTIETAAAQAMRWFERALTLKPDSQSRAQIDWDLRTLYKRFLHLSGQKINADTEQTAMSYISLANAYRQQRRLDDAIREYQAALSINPALAKAHYWLGVTYYEQSNSNENEMSMWDVDLPTHWDDAINELQTALRIDPNHAEAHLNHYYLGLLYQRRSQLKKAIGELQAAVEIAPNLLRAHFELGMAYGQQNQLEEAINEYQAVLRISPDHAKDYSHSQVYWNYAQAHYHLSAIFKKQGRLEEAESEYRPGREWRQLRIPA